MASQRPLRTPVRFSPRRALTRDAAALSRRCCASETAVVTFIWSATDLACVALLAIKRDWLVLPRSKPFNTNTSLHTSLHTSIFLACLERSLADVEFGRPGLGGSSIGNNPIKEPSSKKRSASSRSSLSVFVGSDFAASFPLLPTKEETEPTARG